MKGAVSHVILTFIVVLLGVSGSAFAQDAGMSDIEIVGAPGVADRAERVYTPGEEIRYVPHATSAAKPADSVVLQIQDFPMQQATMRPPDTASEKEVEKQKDDSILTFNFLYYIIQKYKLQDIID